MSSVVPKADEPATAARRHARADRRRLRRRRSIAIAGAHARTPSPVGPPPRTRPAAPAARPLVTAAVARPDVVSPDVARPVVAPPAPAPERPRGEPYEPTSPGRRLMSATLLGLLAALLGLAAAAAVGLVAIALFVLVRGAVG